VSTERLGDDAMGKKTGEGESGIGKKKKENEPFIFH
jgi:hypothetical protein